MAKEALEKEFPDLRVEIANGEVKPGPIRDKLIGDFKKGEIDILLGNPQTIGTGFNLQLSSLVVSLASDYSFYKRDQLEGRIRRPGAKGDSCTYVDIMAKDTVDDKIYKVLREKKDLLEYMRGKSFKEFVRGEVD
jgi:SNF2 family DNA or RNA helicase